MNRVLQSRDKTPPVSARRPERAQNPQNRLRVGEHNDSFEYEADRAADQVMGDGKGNAGMSLSRVTLGAAPVQRKCACGSPGCSKDCDEGKKKEEKPKAAGAVQRRAIDPYTPDEVPPVLYDVLNSPGMPLDLDTRRFFEPRFGTDFSQVRIHADDQAAQSARAVNAHAWTVGQDIVFAPGRYAPKTTDGRKLLAHELAHTIQQRGTQRPTTAISGNRNGEYRRLEREAKSAATGALSAENPPRIIRPAVKPTLSRADGDDPEAQPDPVIKPAPSTTPKPVHSPQGLHTVTPTEVLTSTKKDAAGKETVEAVEEFDVEPFFLPAEKGPNALAVYENMKGQGLQAVLTLQGTGRTKTALWQLRPDTQDLKHLWQQKVKWDGASAKEVNDLWERCGGDKDFPKIKTHTCEMDHIVELQVGGNNPPENIQPLDRKPNQSSGGQIKQQMEVLAKTINADKSLSSGTAQQIKLRFTAVKQVGTPAALTTTCPAKGAQPACLDVEKCAKELKTETSPAGTVTVAHAEYAITAGGRPPTKLKVPVTYASRPTETVNIEGDSLNDAASTLIPGLLLTKLSHVKGALKDDVVEARIDSREKTRLPISFDKGVKAISLKVNQSTDASGNTVGDLKLNPLDKKGALAFYYKYLSPGTITELTMDDSGEIGWKGSINNKLLGNLGIEYSKQNLWVVKGLEESDLKKRDFLGMRFTKSTGIKVQLAPDFKPEGEIGLEMGPAAKPLATASLKLSYDSTFVAKGSIKLNVPKLQKAEGDVTYFGGDRNEWVAEVHIQSQDFKLGSASVAGQLDGKVEKGALTFAGQITATFPGENVAKLGLKKTADDWILYGGGTFHVPKTEANVDPITVHIEYSLGKEKLVASGKAGFAIPKLGAKGKLEEITVELDKDLSFDNAKIYGKGSLDFQKGKVAGHADVELLPTRKFSGKGSLTYEIKPGLTVTGEAELDKNQKLHINGTLKLARLELFPAKEYHHDLFNLDLPVPIPGLSLGDRAGLIFHIKAGVGAKATLGPGAIEPLIFQANFDPLEPDPNVALGVTGTAKVSASATISAHVTGELDMEIDVAIASAGIGGALTAQGDLTLNAGAFADLNATYKDKKLAAKIDAGIKTSLLLGLSLTATARAWAGAFGITGEVRKDWTLAQKTIDTGIGFELHAPFEYADDTGIKLPEAKDITVKKPQLNFDNILDQLFHDPAAKEHKTEK